MLLYAIMFGVLLDTTILDYSVMEPPIEVPANEPWYIELMLGYQYRWLFVEGIARVDMWRAKDRFWPNQLTSVIRGGIRHGIFEIGFEHSCFHPVTPYEQCAVYNLQYEYVPRWEGMYSQIYCRLSNLAY